MAERIVTLDVSGTIFKVEEFTFLRIPLFKEAYEGSNRHLNETVWVPRSSKLFHHILGLAIDDTYPYPAKYFSELKYYGLHSQPTSGLEPEILASGLANTVILAILIAPSRCSRDVLERAIIGWLALYRTATISLTNKDKPLDMEAILSSMIGEVSKT